MSIHYFSERPSLYLCQLSLGFSVKFGRWWMPKSVTMHYSTPSHLDRHYSNSFRVNKTISINCSSGRPWLCPCQLSLDFTLEFLEKISRGCFSALCENDLFKITFPITQKKKRDVPVLRPQPALTPYVWICGSMDLCINCCSIWKHVMEIYRQSRNRLYWIRLIAQP